MIHRVGIVPVGEAAIYVGIAARHRAEAFALLDRFMDRLETGCADLETPRPDRQPSWQNCKTK